MKIWKKVLALSITICLAVPQSAYAIQGSTEGLTATGPTVGTCEATAANEAVPVNASGQEAEGNEGSTDAGQIAINLTAPEVNSPQSADNGIRLSWEPAANASGYGVFKKSGSSYSLVAVTSGTSYTDTSSLSNGTTYTYSIRAYYGTEEEAEVSSYSDNIWGPETTVSSRYIAKPGLSTISNTSDGIKITWEKVANVSGYAVYRKVSNGSWSMIGTTSSNEYSDKSVSSGTTYYYTVRAYIGSPSSNRYLSNNWSYYDKSGLSSTYLQAVSITGHTAVSNGTKLSWSKVSGASGYAVYCKTSDSSYSLLGTTTSASFTDTKTRTDQETYYYMVRAYKGSWGTAKSKASTLMSAEGKSCQVRYYKTPKLKSASAGANGTTITWSATNSNVQYVIYRKKAGGSWSKIGSTYGTSYTDKSKLSSGATYYYTVRAINKYYGYEAGGYDANFCSGYDSNGLKAVYLSTPTLNQPSVSSSKVTVSWGKVSGASGYAVYRKKKGGSWTMIATTTSTKYVDKSSKSSGVAYIYTVRAYKGSAASSHKYNAAYWSGYDTDGNAVVIGNFVKNSGAKSSYVAKYNNSLAKLPAWMKGMYLSQGRTVTAIKSTKVSGNATGIFDGNIKLANVADSNNGSSVVLHEMGHWVDYMFYKKKSTYASRTSEFNTIYKAEFSKFKKVLNYSYESYSSANSKKSEMFANAFAMYYTNPSKLKKNCPKTYAYIQKEIKALKQY